MLFLSSQLYRLLFIVVFVCFGIGCSDLEEPDLAAVELSLIAPSEGVRIVQGEVRFAWNNVFGVDGYQFELATPTFSNATALVAREVLSDAEYAIILTPGEYEWQVSAFNAGSQAQVTPQRFVVVDTLRMDSLQVANYVQ